VRAQLERWSWSLVGLSGAAGVIALAARANLFPFGSGDSDEAVYVYQARMLSCALLVR